MELSRIRKLDETFCTNSASQTEKLYKKSILSQNISVENIFSSFEDINIHNFRTHKSVTIVTVSYWDSIEIGMEQVKKNSPLCWKTSDSCKMGNYLGNCSCNLSEMANLQQAHGTLTQTSTRRQPPAKKQKIEVITIDTSDSDTEKLDWSSSSSSEDEVQITKVVRVSRRARHYS